MVFISSNETPIATEKRFTMTSTTAKLVLTKIRHPRSKVENVMLASGQIVQMITPPPYKS